MSCIFVSLCASIYEASDCNSLYELTDNYTVATHLAVKLLLCCPQQPNHNGLTCYLLYKLSDTMILSPLIILLVIPKVINWILNTEMTIKWVMITRLVVIYIYTHTQTLFNVNQMAACMVCHTVDLEQNKGYVNEDCLPCPLWGTESSLYCVRHDLLMLLVGWYFVLRHGRFSEESWYCS